jgi:hypothetical protein
MAYLDHFNEEQRELLIKLPYRAGLWVSVSDTTGGDDSDEAEKMALANIVRSFTEDFLKSEFVEEVMRETVARRDQWDKWSTQTDAIPDEVRKGIEIASAHIDYKHIHALKLSLMDVAMAVAMAYRELDESTPLMAQVRIYSKYWLEHVRAYILKTQPPIMEQFLNISQDEHKALDILSGALRMKEIEGVEPANLDQEAAA